MPILHHEAHRAFLQLGGIKAQPEGRGALACHAIRGLDLQNGLKSRDAGPDAGDGEQAFGSQRQGIGAAVEPGFGPGRRGAGIDHGDPQARLRQGNSQGGAVQPAACDQNIGVQHHADQYGATRGFVHAPKCRRKGNALYAFGVETGAKGNEVYSFGGGWVQPGHAEPYGCLLVG